VRLLIVDDDQVFREELSELLTEEGHVVQTASSVPKAIPLLEHDEFEVLLTDLRMPRQGGLELVRIARERWPRMYVVVITGYATVETAVEAMKRGAFDYIQKPFQLSRIRKVLETIREDQSFRGSGGPVTDPATVLRHWAEKRDRAILFLGEAPPVKPVPSVTFVPLDPQNPYRIREEVQLFAASHPNPFVLIDGVDRLLANHRLEEILELLGTVRGMLDGRGALAVGLDSRRVPAASLLALRASVASRAVQSTVEGFANPIRRAVLRRLGLGPCSFTELLRAVDLEDSPKLSFHLHRLEEAGLIAHPGEAYGITDKGRAALELLQQLDSLGTGGRDGDSVFVTA
jgi:FixJ family two-component response regulator/DNA-binding HxlR family transcriptional regulator